MNTTGLSEILHHSFKFLSAHIDLEVALALLSVLFISWRYFRGMRIKRMVRGLTFEPHGLREPISLCWEVEIWPCRCMIQPVRGARKRRG